MIELNPISCRVVLHYGPAATVREKKAYQPGKQSFFLCKAAVTSLFNSRFAFLFQFMIKLAHGRFVLCPDYAEIGESFDILHWPTPLPLLPPL